MNFFLDVFNYLLDTRDIRGFKVKRTRHWVEKLWLTRVYFLPVAAVPERRVERAVSRLSVWKPSKPPRWRRGHRPRRPDTAGSPRIATVTLRLRSFQPFGRDCHACIISRATTCITTFISDVRYATLGLHIKNNHKPERVLEAKCTWQCTSRSPHPIVLNYLRIRLSLRAPLSTLQRSMNLLSRTRCVTWAWKNSL